MAHVGPAALADWMLHVGGLAAFSTFNAAGGAPHQTHTHNHGTSHHASKGVIFGCQQNCCGSSTL